MADIPNIPPRNEVRIPNLPMGPLVDKDGKATPEEMTFRQALLTLLQTIAGNEGLVMPSQTTDNITTIVNNQQAVPGATPPTTYTCAPGAFLYNSTSDTVQVTVLVAGVPTIKTVTVT